MLDAMLRIGERFGVPCLILAVLLYFTREAAIAVHGTVLQPVVRSHVEFLETTSETLREIGDVQRQQAQALGELSKGHNEMRVLVREYVEGNRRGG
jgi:hypothetical protein